MKIVSWTCLVLLTTALHTSGCVAEGFLTEREFGQGSGIDTLGAPVNDSIVTFLPVDEAFSLTFIKENDVLQLRWLIHQGYYLYRDRLNVVGGAKEASLTFPQGKLKHDEIFGEVEVYYDELVVNLPLSEDLMGDSNKLTVGYQGCADAGLCYPPQVRNIRFEDQVENPEK